MDRKFSRPFLLSFLLCAAVFPSAISMVSHVLRVWQRTWRIFRVCFMLNVPCCHEAAVSERCSIESCILLGDTTFYRLFSICFRLCATLAQMLIQPQANVTIIEVRNSTSSFYPTHTLTTTTIKPLAPDSLVSTSNENQVFAKRSGEVRSSRGASESRRKEEEVLDALTAKESMEILQTMILGGKPGVDFPNYARAPRTKFNCRKMEYGGMFADPETGCQAYHVCYNRRKDTFICPTGTLFNQQIMACDFWYNVNCETATEYYNMNIPLYHPYQGRGAGNTPAPSPTARPSVNRSDRPIAENPSLNPVPATSGPRPVFEVSPTPRSGFNPPPPTRKPTIVTIITLGSTPSTTTSTTTPTTTTTTPRPYFSYSTTSEPSSPRTRKPTTSRVRIVTVPRHRPRSQTTPRPLPPGIEVDDRDWVFAWLKSGNGTRADKGVLPENAVTQASATHKMTAENYPLLSLTGLDADKRKTETAFSFDHNLVPKPDTAFDFHHRTGSASPSDPRISTSSAFDLGIDVPVKPYILIKRRESELRGEAASHPSPWLFPIESESSRT